MEVGGVLVCVRVCVCVCVCVCACVRVCVCVCVSNLKRVRERKREYECEGFKKMTYTSQIASALKCVLHFEHEKHFSKKPVFIKNNK